MTYNFNFLITKYSRSIIGMRTLQSLCARALFNAVVYGGADVLATELPDRVLQLCARGHGVGARGQQTYIEY